jgi:hypothetical protein
MILQSNRMLDPCIQQLAQADRDACLVLGAVSRRGRDVWMAQKPAGRVKGSSLPACHGCCACNTKEWLTLSERIGVRGMKESHLLDSPRHETAEQAAQYRTDGFQTEKWYEHLAGAVLTILESKHSFFRSQKPGWD